jgi:hypothetical protein
LRYELFLGMSCFWVWAVFEIRAVFKKKGIFVSVRDLSIFGWEVVLGYFAKISIFVIFPLACQKQGIG